MTQSLIVAEQAADDDVPHAVYCGVADDVAARLFNTMFRPMFRMMFSHTMFNTMFAHCRSLARHIHAAHIDDGWKVRKTKRRKTAFPENTMSQLALT